MGFEKQTSSQRWRRKKKAKKYYFFNLVKNLNRLLKIKWHHSPLTNPSHCLTTAVWGRDSHHHIFTGRNRQRQVFWSRKGKSARTSIQTADADDMLLTGAWANAQPHVTPHLTDNKAWFVLPDQKSCSFYIPSTLCTKEITLKGILWAMDALQLKFECFILEKWTVWRA